MKRMYCVVKKDLFHCLYVFKDYIYYLEEMDAIVIFKSVEDIIHIYDIISKEKVSFNNLAHKIAAKEDQKFFFISLRILRILTSRLCPMNRMTPFL